MTEEIEAIVPQIIYLLKGRVGIWIKMGHSLKFMLFQRILSYSLEYPDHIFPFFLSFFFFLGCAKRVALDDSSQGLGLGMDEGQGI